MSHTWPARTVNTALSALWGSLLYTTQRLWVELKKERCFGRISQLLNEMGSDLREGWWRYGGTCVSCWARHVAVRVGYSAGEQQAPWRAGGHCRARGLLENTYWFFLFCLFVGGQLIISLMLFFPSCQKKNDGKYQEMGHLLFIIALRKKVVRVVRKLPLESPLQQPWATSPIPGIHECSHQPPAQKW